jgi:hypothetical protein
MFRYRLQRRRWAAGVLLLWLFGVGAGVANACLLPNPAQHGGHVAAHASDAFVLQGVLHDETADPGVGHHHGSGPVHADEDAPGHPSHASQSNCADFCNKVSVSIPLLKSALDDVQGHAPPPPAAVSVLPMSAFLSVLPWVPRRDGVRAPLIHIAFLRLAL